MVEENQVNRYYYTVPSSVGILTAIIVTENNQTLFSTIEDLRRANDPSLAQPGPGRVYGAVDHTKGVGLCLSS